MITPFKNGILVFFLLTVKSGNKTKSVSLLPQVGTSYEETIYLIVPLKREKLGMGVPLPLVMLQVSLLGVVEMIQEM
jgi:hypothetical protein